MCEHRFLETSYTKVCVQCGVEHLILTLDKYAVHSAPLTKGYERSVRFRQKIDKLLCLQNAPPLKCPIWEYLSKQNMRSPTDVRYALRRYTLKNKHYDCIRLFTRVFTDFRVVLKQTPPRLNQQLTDKFNNVIRLWRRYNMVGTTPFFSYDFLLRVFLEELKCPLVVYCKPVTCLKRHARNNRRLNLISALGGDGTCYRMIAKARLRSGLPNVKSRPCPRRSAESLLAACVVPGALCRDTHLLNDLHALLNTSGTKQDDAAT